MIHYKCACGKSYQSDELAAGEQVRCRACGSVLTVPDPAAGVPGPPEGEVFLSPGCPICETPFASGQVICTACGYDTVTERKMKTDMGAEPSAADPVPPAKEAGSRWRPIALCIVIAAVVLLVVAIILRIGSEASPSMDAEKQRIREHVTEKLRGTGYEAGEFTECVDEGKYIRFTLPIEDAAGLEAGEATGTLDRRSGEPQEPSVTITFH